MRLCISNLAWAPEDDSSVADVMRDWGITHVELAPTKVWRDPGSVTRAEAIEYRQFWAETGIAIAALQSLLFGKPHLSIFGSTEVVAETAEYLGRVTRLAAWLGATRLVFGSPKNRLKGDLSTEAAAQSAVRFFRSASDRAANLGVVLCLEPNPPEYGADFVTRAEEGVSLVRAVDSPGFGLHLDTACMTLAGDDPEAVMPVSGSLIRHVHLSEPRLDPLGSGGVDHRRFATALRQIAYTGLLSIEMLPPAGHTAADAVDAALAAAASAYL